MMMISARLRVLLPVLGALFAGLANHAFAARPLPAPVADDALPPVAAQYRTTVSRDHKTAASEWRYWRNANSVQREDLADRTGDLWQRDGATLFHTLLFHEDRRGIEFEQVDLQMAGANMSWAQQAQIVSPDLLAKLKLVKSGWQRDIPYRDYAGTIGDVRWRVRMRIDLQLPIRVEQHAAHDTLRIELLEAHALAAAPWQPTPATGYGMVDFADLGDHERDPFVLRVQAHLGVGHGHEH
jgi:hypothetical protein